MSMATTSHCPVACTAAIWWRQLYLQFTEQMENTRLLRGIREVRLQNALAK
jgi:hypothetical protein